MKKLLVATITLTAIGVAVKVVKENKGISKEITSINKTLSNIHLEQPRVRNAPFDF